MEAYIGLDVGAVSTNVAVLDRDLRVIAHRYLRTEGSPISAIIQIMAAARESLGHIDVAGCGTTGSGRHLAAALVGADIVKNEITAHAVGALHFYPESRTIIEIGGQDSKIIVIRDGVVTDFAMNTVCAAGTGSFLDHQATRMGVTIEGFAELAAASEHSVRVSGRCAVFAETDMIEKQQRGVGKEPIARGLCESLVRNFLSGVAGGKEITPPVMFQGGVASNAAVRDAFERELGMEITVPEYHDVMGAVGVAVLAGRQMAGGAQTRFKGFDIEAANLVTRSLACDDCPNSCMILEIFDGTTLLSRWGSRCGKWDDKE
ncbi:MAG: acyl-CoA dehydratase activase [Candidatus Eisenbacteria bacterium]